MDPKNATYAAMIEGVDEGVGRVMARLDELKLASRTVVVFTSDNGGLLQNPSNKPLRAGKGDLRLVEFFEDNRVELYNLKEDIGKTKDLAAAMPAKAEELRKLLADWRASVGAQMPTPNPDYDPKGK